MNRVEGASTCKAKTKKFFFGGRESISNLARDVPSKILMLNKAATGSTSVSNVYQQELAARKRMEMNKNNEKFRAQRFNKETNVLQRSLTKEMDTIVGEI